jgi:rhodanese-related sulfurtransferase
MKNSLLQAVVIIAAGFVLAVVSNAIASRDRRLVLPGYYPGAREVPRAVAPIATRSVVIPPPGSPVAGPGGVRAQEPIAVPVPVTNTVAAKKPSNAKAPATSDPRPATHLVESTPTHIEGSKQFVPHPETAYIEVSGDDAQQLHANGALTLDARRTSVYEQGHIAGARSFSVWESDVDDKVNKLYEERNDPREQLKPILVYCSGGDCEDSHMLAQKLWGVQFNNVYVYKDGFPDWQTRGGSIHTGSNP